jgi:uncharacterized protein YegJ (DUF2314 family)
MGLWSMIKGWFRRGKSRQLEGKAGRDARPKATLVLLSERPAQLSVAVLREIVESQLGLTLPEGGKDAAEFVAGEDPFFFIQCGGRLYHLMCMPTPYFEDRQSVADGIRELRLSQAIARHRAFVAIDLMHEEDDASADNPYAVMGKVLAPLARTRGSALYWPNGPDLWLYDAHVAKALESDDPLASLRESLPSQVPVVSVPDDDPRLLRAAAEARRRWPEFVAAFETREPGQAFSVKARFSEGASAEFMWMKVTAIEANIIYGMLDNEPVNLKRLKPGQRLRVPVSELSDWLFTQGEELHGAFSVKVIQQIQREIRGE